MWFDKNKTHVKIDGVVYRKVFGSEGMFLPDLEHPLDELTAYALELDGKVDTASSNSIIEYNERMIEDYRRKVQYEQYQKVMEGSYAKHLSRLPDWIAPQPLYTEAPWYYKDEYGMTRKLKDDQSQVKTGIQEAIEKSRKKSKFNPFAW